MDQHEGCEWFEPVVTMLATIGLTAIGAVLFMVGSRIASGHWPACGW